MRGPGSQLRRLCLIVSPRTLLRWHADLVRRPRCLGSAASSTNIRRSR